MIIVTDMTPGLAALLAPYGFAFVDGVYESSDDAACQAIINSYDFVPEWRAMKTQEIRDECLVRIQSVMPGVADYPMLEMVRTLWLSIAAAARQPTAALNTVVNVYTAARNAITSVATQTTKATIFAVTPVWPA